MTPNSVRRITRSARSISRDLNPSSAAAQPRKKRPRVASSANDSTGLLAQNERALLPSNTSRDRARPPAVQHRAVPCRDDPDGHLIFKLGDGLYPTSDFPQGRYKILSSLGEGTFGKVVECWDRRVHRRVAVKIVRSISKYREAALLEIDVLVQISFHDPEGVFHCVKLFSWFEHLSHVCMVFEKLGPSLYEHLRKKRFQPFSIDEVRSFAFQLLESVSFVHRLTLIHTDLKPENVLLLDANHPQSIKLIDFGSATFQHQHHSAVVSTRHYRAPEVILGLGWTYPCDLWSVGCILVELYTGQALFQTHENLEHLAMMSVVLGPIPQRMIRRANPSCSEYFRTKRGGDGATVLNWPGGASSKSSVRSVRRVRSLTDMVNPDSGGAHFLDLLKRLLAFEPETRCTSEEALSHPFFMESKAHANPPESDYLPTSITHSSGSSTCLNPQMPATLPRPINTNSNNNTGEDDTSKTKLAARERRLRLRSRSKQADDVGAASISRRLRSKSKAEEDKISAPASLRLRSKSKLEDDVGAAPVGLRLRSMSKVIDKEGEAPFSVSNAGVGSTNDHAGVLKGRESSRTVSRSKSRSVVASQRRRRPPHASEREQLVPDKEAW